MTTLTIVNEKVKNYFGVFEHRRRHANAAAALIDSSSAFKFLKNKSI
jgi:hypothetical protein